MIIIGFYFKLCSRKGFLVCQMWIEAEFIDFGPPFMWLVCTLQFKNTASRSVIYRRILGLLHCFIASDFYGLSEPPWNEFGRQMRPEPADQHGEPECGIWRDRAHERTRPSFVSFHFIVFDRTKWALYEWRRSGCRIERYRLPNPLSISRWSTILWQPWILSLISREEGMIQ